MSSLDIRNNFGCVGQLEHKQVTEERPKEYAEMIANDVPGNPTPHTAVWDPKGLSFGERVHDYVEEHGYGKSVKICNSLIAMYARCGYVDKVVWVFRGMLLKDVVTWTALIIGLMINGKDRYVIEAFTEIQRRGVHPNVQTFTRVYLIGPRKSSLMATKHDSTTTPVAATEDVIQTLIEHLVQPLLPTKAKGETNLSRQ
ncbi:hypothetical protein GIB67_010553 [Kingdonia uniflora]|uniref:Pentatricopeptide repeat-containing protein n=1 Tax=Kingdonia uniflora TaxID=39325 RepID=A0A7J7MAV0_9MAGN|nr:hypothetical protein GIB67_010553 [Kingdonia uniflora]